MRYGDNTVVAGDHGWPERAKSWKTGSPRCNLKMFGE